MRLATLLLAAMAVGQMAATPVHATVAPQWRLADAPVFEIGRDDGVLLHLVQDAVFAPDGSLLVADNSGPRILRVSSTGEVVESRGGEGDGPGEFERILRVFALGDTVLAFDPFLSRVTTWVGDADPEVVTLPKPGGVGTNVAGVVSARVWVLSTWGNRTADRSSTALREVWGEILLFRADTREVAKLDRRLVKYDYHVVEKNSFTTYNVAFLGQAQISATRSQWLFVPIDEAVLLRGGLAGDATSAVPLPVRPQSYETGLLRREREDWLSRARDAGSSTARVRLVFDNLSGELPAQAPAVRQLVHVGTDVWLRKFGNESEAGTSEWIVVDPSDGKVRSTALIGAEVELLGGNDTLAVVLVKTELGEEIVQVRQILR